MSDSFSLAEKHLSAGLDEASENNISTEAYGQALIWKLIERYKALGRSNQDIVQEIQFTLENIDEDGTFHVVRN